MRRNQERTPDDPNVWRIAAEQFLRLAAPADFGEVPIYIVCDSADEAGAKFDREGAGGYTGGLTGPFLKPYLTGRGLWRGPGFATVIHESDARPWDRMLSLAATVWHEACHFVGEPLEQFWPLPPRLDETMEKFVALPEFTINAGAPHDRIIDFIQTQRDHGAQFIRVAMHLHHRLSRIAGELVHAHFEDATGWPIYRRLPSHVYRRLLGSELRDREKHSLRDIHNSPIPPEFERLARADMVRAIRWEIDREVAFERNRIEIERVRAERLQRQASPARADDNPNPWRSTRELTDDELLALMSDAP